MKSLHKTLVLSLMIASSSPDWAGETHDRLSLRHIKAVRPDTTLNLLDSVVSDSYRKIYQYNEYGYITSMKVYNKAADWELDTRQSYEQTYTFNAGGQCTERVRYSLKPNGQRSQMIDRGAIEQENDYTWERYWYTNDYGKTYLSEAYAYDRQGNQVITAEYDYDSCYDDTYLSSYHEKRYSRKLPPKNHCNYQSFVERCLTYELKGREEIREVPDAESPGGSSVKKVFRADICRKVTSEINGDMLVIKEFGIPWDKEFSLDKIDDQWKESEYEFEMYRLNAACTRPIAGYDRVYTPEPPVEPTRAGRDSSCNPDTVIAETWQWDDKGRLVKYTVPDVDNRTLTQTYTYADDYAPQLSLQDVMDWKWGLVLYPEDYFNFYGHVATCHSKTSYGLEDQKMEYDAQGRLKRIHYTETDTVYNEVESQGTITYYYRADGHLDHETDISNEYGNTYYLKTVYTYDDMGTWTGLTEYEGKSENGPWHKTYSPSKSHRQAGMHRLQTKRRIGEDMSEGGHRIDETQGIWAREGYYYVENGEIVQGHYYEWLVSDARVPSDPELNYTDPTMPLDYGDDWDIEISGAPWIYEWDGDTKMWTLKYAPDYAHRVYRDGMQVKRDRYNSEKEITETDTYSFDNDGRLVRQETSGREIPQGSNYMEYNYLDDDSNYLSTCLTYNAGASELRRYYYSRHLYVKPTDIDGVNATDKADNQHYDLQGRKVSRPSRGIYIHKGVKVLVR